MDFGIYMEMLCETSMKDVISLNLTKFPVQTAVGIEDFSKLIFQLINSANIRILKPQIDRLIQTPFY